MRHQPGFFQLSIARKILYGYLCIATLTIAIGIFTLTSLERLNRINSSIVEINAPLIKITENMYETLLAQERHGRRYIILKSPETLQLFRERISEFHELVNKLKMLPGREDLPISDLAELHDEYSRLFGVEFELMSDPASPEAKEYDRLIRERQEELFTLLRKISASAWDEQNGKILMISATVMRTFWITVALCSFGIVFGIGAALLITKNISGSIQTLKQATSQIAEGNFENVPMVKSGDELGELSHAFDDMSKRLKRLEEMYLDASPLTHLPGGIAIENVLKKRLSTGHPIAFCLFDLDDFKAFNDRYGYARGSELIKKTSTIIESAVREHGSADEFVGHIGGDDFVVITTPDTYHDICVAVMEELDRAVPEFYDQKDRENGYIVSKSRQGQTLRFPFVSISIAVVTNQDRTLENHIQVGEIAAELKEHAKSISGSSLVVDHRKKEK